MVLCSKHSWLVVIIAAAALLAGCGKPVVSTPVYSFQSTPDNPTPTYSPTCLYAQQQAVRLNQLESEIALAGPGFTQSIGIAQDMVQSINSNIGIEQPPQGGAVLRANMLAVVGAASTLLEAWQFGEPSLQQKEAAYRNAVSTARQTIFQLCHA